MGPMLSPYPSCCVHASLFILHKSIYYADVWLENTFVKEFESMGKTMKERVCWDIPVLEPLGYC